MDDLFYRRLTKRLSVGGLLKKAAKNKRLVLIVLVALPVLSYAVFGSRGVLQRIRLQQQKTELQVKIKEAEEETKRLQEQSNALDNDKKAIEKVAREQYGMARDGETVYKVNRDK
jgi:cell division protein FtsB